MFRLARSGLGSSIVYATRSVRAAETTQFLTSLAVQRKVADVTQDQALSALPFLYREVFEQEVPWLDSLVRAKRPRRLPVVLRRDEVRAVLDQMSGAPRLMALLLAAVKAGLARHLEFMKRQHEQDLKRGAGWVELPGALTQK